MKNTLLKPTLIFDLAETLVGGLFWMVKPTADALNVPEEEILQGLGGDPLTAFLEGRCTEAAYWQAVLRQTGWQTTAAVLGDFARQSFRQVVPGMPDLLAQLQEYPLVLLSDHAREWIAYIDQQHDFLHIFERRFISFEMQRTKRSRETFHYVAAQLNRRPENCLFVDDLHWNVVRAAEVGLTALQFSTAEALRADLQKHGIALR